MVFLLFYFILWYLKGDGEQMLTCSCSERSFALYHFAGQTKADQTYHHLLPVLQRWLRHPAVHRRGSSRAGHPRGGLDRAVRPSRWPQGQYVFGVFFIAYAALVCHVKLLSLIKNSQNRTNLKVDFSPTGVHPQGGSDCQRHRWSRPRPPHPAARRTRLPAVPQTGQGELTTCLVISVVRTHTDF